METNAIVSSTQPAAGVNRFAELNSTDFIRVLMTELQNQDPFEPQDSAALLEQLSSIRNIESQLSLQETLEDLVLQNQIAGAGNLIGHYVEGLNDSNDRIAGEVTAVRVVDKQVILELDSGQALMLKQVSSITAAEATAPAAL